jgi:hypothetical protein
MPTDDFPEKFHCFLVVFLPLLVFLTNKKITVQVYLSKYFSCNIDDSKGIIKSRKPKKDRQLTGQTKRDKRINNDLQITTQKNKDRATRTPLKTGVDSDIKEGFVVSAPLVTPVMLL